MENTINFKTMKESGKGDSKIPKKVIITAVIVIIAIVLFSSAVTIVPAGHTGVVVTLGKVSETVLGEGFHLKVPFITNIVTMSNQIQKSEIENAESVSKDLQSISSTIVVNYKVANTSSADIYKNIGKDYQDIVLLPAVNESLKAVTAKYTAEELVTLRSQVALEIEETLEAKMKDYGIIIEKFNIVNFSFSEEFAKAIEEKEVAAQNLLKAKTEQAQVIVEANAQAEKKVIAAEAEAKAIIAKAEAQAKANQTLSKSLNDDVIEYYKVDKWDGVMPKSTGGSAILDLTDDEPAK